MADNKFQIVISAADKATAVINKINANVGKMTKPINDVGKGIAKFKKISGLEGFLKTISGVSSKFGEGMASAFGGPAASVMGGAGIASLEGMTAAVMALTVEFGRYSQQMMRTSAMTGVSTDNLQSLAGAAKLAGISADTMTSSVGALGRTVNDALNGRNDQAAALMAQLGLQVRRTADGAVDAADMFRQLSSRLADLSPQTRATVLGVMGIDASLAPMMMKLKESEERARDLGAAMGPEAVARANAFAASLNALGIAAEGAGWRIADKFLPALTSAADTWARMLSHPDASTSVAGVLTGGGAVAGAIAGGLAGTAIAPGIGTIVGAGIGAVGGGAGAGVATGMGERHLQDRESATKISYDMPAASSRQLPDDLAAELDAGKSLRGATAADKVMNYYKAQGWKDYQAAGIAANFGKESQFNPAAVGDNGQAYGIAQWHPDRQAAFRQWSGKDIHGSSLEDQLAFAQWEMTNGEYKPAGDALRQTKTAADAGAVTSLYYERPKAAEAEAKARASAADVLAGGDGTAKITVDINVNHEGGVTASARSDKAGAVSLGPTRVGQAMPDGAFPG
jgi:Phage tail lysozyme